MPSTESWLFWGGFMGFQLSAIIALVLGFQYQAFSRRLKLFYRVMGCQIAAWLLGYNALGYMFYPRMDGVLVNYGIHIAVGASIGFFAAEAFLSTIGNVFKSLVVIPVIDIAYLLLVPASRSIGTGEWYWWIPLNIVVVCFILYHLFIAEAPASTANSKAADYSTRAVLALFLLGMSALYIPSAGWKNKYSSPEGQTEAAVYFSIYVVFGAILGLIEFFLVDTTTDVPAGSGVTGLFHPNQQQELVNSGIQQQQPQTAAANTPAHAAYNVGTTSEFRI